MKIKTTKIPVKMGNVTCKIPDIKVGCRFGIRLLIYFILLIFTGPYFGNWTTTEKYFCRLDIYSRECSLSERLGPATENFRCAAQRFKIAKLGSICRLSVLTIGFVLGLLLDILGPKLTFLIGISMRILSWFIFSIRGVSNSLIIFSSVILGLSRNAIAYPTLTIYMYTSNFKEYSTTIMGIGITLAGLYIIVIERIMGYTNPDPYKFTLYSMLITHIPCMIIGFLIFPWVSPTPKVKHKTVKTSDGSTTECQLSTDDDIKHREHKSSSSSQDISIYQSDSDNFNFSKLDTCETTIIKIERSQSDADSDVQLDGDIHTHIPIDNSQWNLAKFLRYIKSAEYLVTCPYFVFNFLDFFFMQMMFSTMYGKYSEVMTLNEYLVSFSFILTFLIGLLYKIFNPVTILIFSNFFGILTHFIAFNDSKIAGFIAASTLIAYASILFTQTYIYVQSTFDSKYFGSLIGTINTFSGIVMFFNIVLISLVERYNCINYIHIAMIVVRVICEIALILLNLKRRKRTKSI